MTFTFTKLWVLVMLTIIAYAWLTNGSVKRRWPTIEDLRRYGRGPYVEADQIVWRPRVFYRLRMGDQRLRIGIDWFGDIALGLGLHFVRRHTEWRHLGSRAPDASVRRAARPHHRRAACHPHVQPCPAATGGLTYGDPKA